jgi:outer membrane cobalamin receptor
MIPLALLLMAAAAPPDIDASAISPAIVTSRLATAGEATRGQATILDGPVLRDRSSLADALQTLADVQVQQPSGRSGMASIYLRGADPNFTVVMLDGVPLNDSTNSRGGAVNVSEITPLGLERVELARGPLSSLYGSGALAGAIDLVVPGGAARHGGAVLAAAGLDGEHTVMAQWRGPLAGGYGASLTAIDDDAGDPTPGGRFRGRSVTGKLASLDGDGGARLLFRAGDTHAEGFPDNSGGPRLAALRQVDRRDGEERLLAGRIRPLRQGAASLELSASILLRKDHLVTPGVAPSAFAPAGLPAGEDRTRFQRDNLQAIARFEPASGPQGLIGVAYQREKGSDAGALELYGMSLPTDFRLVRETLSAFAEGGVVTGAWALDLGGRIDRPDGLGRHGAGRAGLRYATPVEGLALRTSLGTGFKAPSFYALGNPFVGNRGLKPETNRSVEVGFEWKFAEGGRLSATAFSSRYADLIDFIPDPYPHLANVSKVTSKGANARLGLSLSARLSAGLDVTYADTRNAEADARLLNRPSWRTVATLDWRVSLTLDARARYGFVGARGDYSVPTGPVTLKAYGALSLEADWRPIDKVTLTAVLDNALDEGHEDAVGFLAPSRQLRLIARRDF